MRRGTAARFAAIFAVLALLLAACDRDDNGGGTADNGQENGSGQSEGGNMLQTITDRGAISCGVNETVPGFGSEVDGELDGFDIDFCRAFAAAILGDSEAVELNPIDADNRFNALRAGDYDVLVRNTTWTASRDGAEGVAFTHPNFYDGQAMMVRVDDGFESVADMDGTNICVTSGTTTELNLADYFQALGIENSPVTFPENPQLQEAFIAGRCDGWTSDASQLAGIRSQWPEEEGGPESLVILDDVMSKEPLAPGVLDGDQEFLDVLNWTVNGMILAEELGVDSNNVDQQIENPDNPGIAALLGVPFEDGEATDYGLGTENTFMQEVLRQVGNYGEVFERHLGPDTPLGLDRGLNGLWTEGGIQYAMPLR